MFKNFVLSGFVIFSLSACATSGNHSYVSEAQYEGYNCRQLKAELQRVSGKIEQKNQYAENEANQWADTALKAFAISRGYSYTEKEDEELKRLNAQYDMLDKLIIKQDCLS